MNSKFREAIAQAKKETPITSDTPDRKRGWRLRGDIPHGELRGYTYHECRCALCRGAMADYQAQRRAKKRAQASQ